MRIVVVGYGSLFRGVIEGCLASGHSVTGVLRVNKVRYSPVMNFFIDSLFPDRDKIFVNNLKLNDINVSSVNSEKFKKILVNLGADIVFVSSWCEKFQEETIKIPKIGTINLHPSLLPKYRGPNPYAQVIKHGEKETGLTFHLMDKEYDSGAILRQKTIPISEKETGESLREKCALYVREETQELLKEFDNGFITPVNQNPKLATYFPQLTLYDSILPFSTESAEQLDRRIRGLTPWLKCCVPLKNDFFMFKEYEILEGTAEKEFGEIVYNDGERVEIATLDHKIMVFRGVYPVLCLPRFLHKKYVKHFLKIGKKAV
ncbi:methionyl-tRNA formyltransferase [bacterium]|nr:methionyl-tRNA formyltransferase [bacterium]